MYICIYVDLLLVALIIKVGFCHRKVLPRSHIGSQSLSKASQKQARIATKSLQEAIPKESSRVLNHKSRLQAKET